MTVARATPSPPMPHPVSGAAQVGADMSPGLTFAELLGREDQPPLVMEGLDFVSSDRQFRASVSVADDAIRFDARPVVAPAGTTETGGAPTPLDDSTLGALGTLTASAVAPAHGAEGTASIDVADLRAAGAFDFQRTRSGEGGGPTGRTQGGSPALASPAIAPAAGPTPPLAPPADRLALSPSSADRPVGTRPLTTRPASITVLPREVLVVVHGLALSSAESRILLQDVRDLLAAHGLGEKSVRLVTEQRRTR